MVYYRSGFLLDDRVVRKEHRKTQLGAKRRVLPSRAWHTIDYGKKLAAVLNLRIPMMPISHSDLMPIRSERSDAGLSQCEIVIDIRQEFCLFSLS
jgi:hypothetical protein